MIKKLLWITLLGAGILMSSFAVKEAFYAKNQEKEINKKIVQNISKDKTFAEEVVDEIMFLEELQLDNSRASEEKLLEYTKRRDSIGYEACLIMAEKYSLSGRDPSVYYKQALELYDSKEVRRKLAASLAANGSYLDAANMYGSLLPDKGVLDTMLKLDIKSWDMARVLLDNKQRQSAVDYLKAAIEETTDSQEKDKLVMQYSIALAEIGDYKQALPVLEKLVLEGLADQELLWWYGRSMEELNLISKAKEVYYNLGEKGAYRLGVLLEKEGKFKEAAQSFCSSIDAESRWRGALIWEDMGRPDKALEAYMLIAREQSVYQDDAAYRAYILASKDKKEEALSILRSINDSPAWLERLDIEPSWTILPAVQYEKPDFLRRVEAYKEIGRGDLAKVELAIGEKYSTVHEKLALGDWYLKSGKYNTAAAWGSRALKEEKSRKAYELSYQRPYEAEVYGASEEFGVNPYLLWALIREESRFQADAVSRVGALGLTQVMPSTGKDIASRLKVSFNEKDLLKPGLNIRFGAFYLSSMLKMFSGDMDKALAAYNGGPGNTQRWSRSKIGKTSSGFPTAVSYLETREYITKVMNSYYIYKWLYEDK